MTTGHHEGGEWCAFCVEHGRDLAGMDAARGEPPEPGPAIVVERLARAMTTVYEEDLFPIKSGDWRYDASLIAAEYDRLRP